MADIRMLTYRDRLLLDQGWFHPNQGYQSVAKDLQGKFDLERDAEVGRALENDIARWLADRAAWAALRDAGIIDPTIDDPTGEPMPSMAGYKNYYPVTVERIAYWGFGTNLQPLGEPVWIMTIPGFGEGRVHRILGWAYDRQDAERMMDSDSRVTGAHYHAALADWRLAGVEALRVRRDWDVIAAAGIIPDFHRPSVPERIPPYVEWRENRLSQLSVLPKLEMVLPAEVK